MTTPCLAGRSPVSRTRRWTVCGSATGLQKVRPLFKEGTRTGTLRPGSPAACAPTGGPRRGQGARNRPKTGKKPRHAGTRPSLECRSARLLPVPGGRPLRQPPHPLPHRARRRGPGAGGGPARHQRRARHELQGRDPPDGQARLRTRGAARGHRGAALLGHAGPRHDADRRGGEPALPRQLHRPRGRGRSRSPRTTANPCPR